MSKAITVWTFIYLPGWEVLETYQNLRHFIHCFFDRTPSPECMSFFPHLQYCIFNLENYFIHFSNENPEFWGGQDPLHNKKNNRKVFMNSWKILMWAGHLCCRGNTAIVVVIVAECIILAFRFIYLVIGDHLAALATTWEMYFHRQ